MANAEKVKLGPGLLHIGPVGVAEPNDLTTPWTTVDSDWGLIGYTEEGHEFSSEPSFEAVEVAEEKRPIRYVSNASAEAVSFSAAELTVDNLERAFNGGTVSTISGTVVRFEPPDDEDEPIYAAIGWESTDGEERWVFRKCIQVGNIAIARRKAPNKSLIPMEFRLVKPAGIAPWTAVMETA